MKIDILFACVGFLNISIWSYNVELEMKNVFKKNNN